MPGRIFLAGGPFLSLFSLDDKRGLMGSPKNYRTLRLAAFICLVIIAGGFVFGVPSAILAHVGLGPMSQEQDREFFPSGYWVSGEFLKYFRHFGGEEIFGYPISSAYVNESGILVQYFQKARMEWHPMNPEPYRVQLGLLGEELGYRRSQVSQPTSLSPRKHYFPETGHMIAYHFLDYFRRHGGIDIFGYPITEMFIENQRVVQYFQRMKLIWDVQANEMMVGDLGEVYLSVYRDRFPVDVLQRMSHQFGAEEMTLDVMVDVRHSVIRSQPNQDITIVVLDDATDRPVQGARVMVWLASEDGTVYVDRALSTGSEGRVEATLPLEDVRPGTYVVVRVEASYRNAIAQARKMFLVWF